jgi:hypothetical protein
LQKFGSFFQTHDLQLGFKKNVGCDPPIFTVQQLVKYFASRGIAIHIATLDASKAFNRVDHSILLNKLK